LDYQQNRRITSATRGPTSFCVFPSHLIAIETRVPHAAAVALGVALSGRGSSAPASAAPDAAAAVGGSHRAHELVAARDGKDGVVGAVKHPQGNAQEPVHRLCDNSSKPHNA
jgi:hypothetical protein